MTERITFHAATDDTRARALAELLSGASLDDVGALFGVKGVTLASYLPMYWSNVVTRNGKVVLLDPSQERTGHVWTEKDYEILIDWHFGDRMQGRPIDDLAGPLRRSVGAVKDQYYLWRRWLMEAVRRQERGERSIPERMAGRGRARATKRRIVKLTLDRYNAHKSQQVQREMVEAVAPAPKADTVEPGPIKSFIVDCDDVGVTPEKLSLRVCSLPGVVETRWGSPHGPTKVEVFFDATLTSIREIVLAMEIVLAIAPSKTDPVEPPSKADPVEPVADREATLGDCLRAAQGAPWVEPQPIVPIALSVENGRIYHTFLVAVSEDNKASHVACWTYLDGDKRYGWQYFDTVPGALDEALFRASRYITHHPVPEPL